MNHKNNDTVPTREQLQPLIDFVLEFDEETQEMWLRLFELQTKQARIEEETEEVDILLSKLQLAIAEQIDGSTATLVAEQQAYQEAFKQATQAELSRLGVHIAAVTAECKVRGDTPSEAEKYVEHVFVGATSADGRGYLNSHNIFEAIDEVRRAGLWPWKGVN